MKSSSSKDKICTNGSQNLYNKILNSQKNRFDIRDLGMIHLIDEIERLRQHWKSAEEATQRLNEERLRLEHKLAEAQKKIDIHEIDMKDTRKHMRAMMEENKALKLDLNVYETREKQLKEAMKKGAFDSLTKEDRDQFAFLKEPLVRTYSKRVQQRHPQLVDETQDDDDSEVDYDVTGDSLDEVVTLRNGREVRRSSAAHGKRRSASAHMAPSAPVMNSKRSRSRVMAATIDEEPVEGGTPPKRCRDENLGPEVTTTTTTTTTLTLRNGGGHEGRPRASLHRQVTRRSMSCGSVPSCETPGHTSVFNGGMSSQAALTKSTLDIRTMRNRMTPAAWTTGASKDIALRPHTFEDVGINLKMTKCDECNSGIFAARSLKCKDCHQTVHKACSSHLHLPCIPRQKTIATPKSANRNVKREYRIQDFCTNAKPMIPFPVVHCVVALEKRALTQEGLYRVPGSTRAVTALLNELRTSKTVPNVELQDSEVITETLKRFLRDLRDPLVPRTSRNEFIDAGNMYTSNPDQGRLELNRVICELPQANRDTMAYLFRHWRKVISMSEVNKMSKENMARVLSPCVMGISTHRADPASATHDISNCERVLCALFAFDDTYWQRFLGSVDHIEAPRYAAVFDRSILGPVSTSPATPLLSRSAATNRRPTANILGPILRD